MKLPKNARNRIIQESAEAEAGDDVLIDEVVDFDDLLREHLDRTVSRARAAGRVLVLHDTTTFSFSLEEAMNLGFLEPAKAGFLLHASMVVDAGTHRRPLGIIHAETLFRDSRSRRGVRQRRARGGKTAKGEDRENLRWSRGVQLSADRLAGCNAIHVMDRAGDCHALLSELVRDELSFVVRCSSNRTRSDSTKLREPFEGLEGLLEREIELSRAPESTASSRRKALPTRPTRKARLRFEASTVELARPRSASVESSPGKPTLHVVHVHEESPPEGQEPISWTLWTSEPVATAEQVAQVVDIYRQRWRIGEYFKALKTGCSDQKEQLESLHELLDMLAISMPIAVEILGLRARVTDDPDAPATDVLSPLQIDILRALGHRPLGEQPTAGQALLCLASLAGHLRSNGAPGWLILMRAYEKLATYELGWTAALEDKKRRR